MALGRRMDEILSLFDSKPLEGETGDLFGGSGIDTLVGQGNPLFNVESQSVQQPKPLDINILKPKPRNETSKVTTYPQSIPYKAGGNPGHRVDWGAKREDEGAVGQLMNMADKMQKPNMYKPTPEQRDKNRPYQYPQQAQPKQVAPVKVPSVRGDIRMGAGAPDSYPGPITGSFVPGGLGMNRDNSPRLQGRTGVAPVTGAQISANDAATALGPNPEKQSKKPAGGTGTTSGPAGPNQSKKPNTQATTQPTTQGPTQRQPSQYEQRMMQYLDSLDTQGREPADYSKTDQTFDMVISGLGGLAKAFTAGAPKEMQEGVAATDEWAQGVIANPAMQAIAEGKQGYIPVGANRETAAMIQANMDQQDRERFENTKAAIAALGQMHGFSLDERQLDQQAAQFEQELAFKTDKLAQEMALGLAQIEATQGTAAMDQIKLQADSALDVIENTTAIVQTILSKDEKKWTDDEKAILQSHMNATSFIDSLIGEAPAPSQTADDGDAILLNGGGGGF